MVEPLEGGCLCGAVRYSIGAAPSGSMLCHCVTCRRVSGAPVVAWITVARAAYRVTRGEPRFFASSPSVQRTLCSACGTPLTYAHRDSPDEIDVTTCSLDQPEAWPPTHHSWTSHGLSWLEFGDGLPRNERSMHGDPG